MMERTDRFCRYFLRLLSRRTLLYTEMITSAALVRGRREHLLAYDAAEHPIALQLGGSVPHEMAQAARMAEDHGYDEVNINVGCPSKRVRAGRFGACLMVEPERVGACVAAMQHAVAIPVTVKTRIGVDDMDSYADLASFVRRVADAGCATFIVHARKAWLHGLSPKQNRSVPPLDYERVVRLKRDFPHLEIVVNGGIVALDQALEHLHILDGVMIGREAYHNPFVLAEADARIFGDAHAPTTRRAVLEAFVPFAARELRRGASFAHVTRHLTGLYQGMPGARSWRRAIGELSQRKDASARDLLRAAPERAGTIGAAAA